MEEQKKRATNALQLLFVASIVAIVLTFVSGSVPWLNLIPVVLNLVGIWMLWSAVRSTKLKVSLITGVICMVLEAICRIAMGGTATLENLGAFLPVSIVSYLCTIVCQVCLFRGIADYMVQHGFPEAAGTGRTLSVLIIVINVLTIVTLGASVAVLMTMGHTYVGGSITAILMLSLATVVVTIVYLVMRIFFFYNCRKKLLMTPPEHPDVPM